MRSTTDLLTAFEVFCKTGAPNEDEEGPFADFEWLANSEVDFLPALVGSAEKATAFEPLGQNGAGCIIAFWRDPEQPESERPLVWLDSEGSPQAVVANSLAELLSLLPYDTILLYNASRANESYQRNPQDAQPPTERFSNLEVQAMLTKSIKRNPGQPRYTRWLIEVVGIQLEKEPMVVIENAYQSHTRLGEWLRQ